MKHLLDREWDRKSGYGLFGKDQNEKKRNTRDAIESRMKCLVMVKKYGVDVHSKDNNLQCDTLKKEYKRFPVKVG